MGEQGVTEGAAYAYSGAEEGRAQAWAAHTAKVEKSERHPFPSHVRVPVLDHGHRTQRVEWVVDVVANDATKVGQLEVDVRAHRDQIPASGPVRKEKRRELREVDEDGEDRGKASWMVGVDAPRCRS